MATDLLREQALAMLDGRGAHMPFDDAIAGFPDEAINRRPPNVPYTPWHLVEHLRLSQADILEYVTDPAYATRPWPEAYWPARDAIASPEQFGASVAGFRADRDTLKRLVADPARDLLAVLPGTPGHTLLREVRLVADHNAYHIGEFAILRQVMDTWPAGHRG